MLSEVAGTGGSVSISGEKDFRDNYARELRRKITQIWVRLMEIKRQV